MLRYFFGVRGLVPAFPCFHWTFEGQSDVVQLEIDTLDQHSVLFQPYGNGKLRQVGALQSAQHQNWRFELIFGPKESLSNGTAPL